MHGGLVLRPLLDVRALARSLWRRRLLLAAAGLLGVIAGAVVASTVLPARFGASTSVLFALTNEESVRPDAAMATQVQLAESTRVVTSVQRRVADELGLQRTTEQVRGSYAAAAASDAVLRVDVSVPERDATLAWSAIVAEEVVAQRLALVAADADARVADLERRLDEQRQVLAELDARIAALLASDPAPGSLADGELTLATTQRADALRTVEALQTRVADERARTQALVTGTVVVVEPEEPTGSALRWRVTVAVALGFVAVVATIGLLAARELVSTRIRLRADLAEATGVGVLGTLQQPRAMLARRLGARRAAAALRSPHHADLAAADAVLAALDRHGAGRHLLLVAVDAPSAAALLTATVVRRGAIGLVVDRTDTEHLATALEAVTAVDRTVAVERVTAAADRPADPLRLARALRSVTVVAFDPEDPRPLATAADAVVLVAAADRSDATAVASAAAWLRTLGAPPAGAVLAAVDRHDHTAGIPSPAWAEVMAAAVARVPVPVPASVRASGASRTSGDDPARWPSPTGNGRAR